MSPSSVDDVIRKAEQRRERIFRNIDLVIREKPLAMRQATTVRKTAMAKMRIADITHIFPQRKSFDIVNEFSFASNSRDMAALLFKNYIDVQYNPSQVVEKQSPYYEMPEGTFGTFFQQGLLFLWNEPRTLSFELFLNSWGEDTVNVSRYLNFLKSLVLARELEHDPGTLKIKEVLYQFKYRPPIVLIIWSQYIVGVITKMEIKHIKWHPVSLEPLRATVKLDVSEQVFFPEMSAVYRTQEGVKRVYEARKGVEQTLE